MGVSPGQAHPQAKARVLVDAGALEGCAHGRLVLGILCVSKGGLFLNFMAPDSVSAFWLGGSSCSQCGPFRERHGICPLWYSRLPVLSIFITMMVW